MNRRRRPKPGEIYRFNVSRYTSGDISHKAGDVFEILDVIPFGPSDIAYDMDVSTKHGKMRWNEIGLLVDRGDVSLVKHADVVDSQQSFMIDATPEIIKND